MTKLNNVSDSKRGRIDTLTEDQELVLKQLWAHLLVFWGYDVTIPTNQTEQNLVRTRTRSSISSNRTGDKDKSKSLRRFGRKPSKHTLKGTNSRRNSINLKHQNSFGNGIISKDYDSRSIHTVATNNTVGTVASDATRNTYNQTLNKSYKASYSKENEQPLNKLEPIESMDTFVTAETTISHTYPVPTPIEPPSPQKDDPIPQDKIQEPSQKVNSSLIHPCLRNLKSGQIQENFWKMLRTDSPDNMLLRFARARRFDTDRTLKMVSTALEWRLKTVQVEKVVSEGDLGPSIKKEIGVMRNFKLFKACIRGVDKEGRPIVIVRPKLHHAKDQTSEEMEKYILLVIEYARLHLLEPVDSCSVLFDLSEFSLSNMDYGPVKFMIGCFEAHYPESLGVLLIHKAPWVFSGIWSIIKNWLDPVVASKINFTKSIKDVTKYIDINNIPEYLGGKHAVDFKYVEPSIEKDSTRDDIDKKTQIEIERDDLIVSFIESTKNWIESTNFDDSNFYLNEKIQLSKQLARNYIRLDPYIRSRGIYDRLGDLNLIEEMIK